MGRPTELTPSVAASLVEAVGSGQTYRGAAEYAGIGERTLYRWLARGESTDDEPYRQLWQDLTRARAKAKHDALCQIREAMTPGEHGVLDWRARAWWLERAFPEEFGKQSVIRLEVERGVQSVMEAVEPHMSREAYSELLDALARITGVDPGEEGEGEELPAEH